MVKPASAAGKQQLPKWAKLTLPQQKRKELSIGEEDAYLRTMSYHAVAAKMNLAFKIALRTTGPDLHRMLARIMGPAANDSHDEATIPKKKRKTDETIETNYADKFTLRPAVSYDPFSLPIVILEGPFAQLDRQVWIQHFVQQSKQSGRTCVVWLQRPTRTVKHATHQHELLRQCLQQEPDPTLFAKRRKHNSSSKTDLLLYWASHTRAFDSVQVFCEVEDYYGSEFSDFLQWTVERRKQGLPLSLILLGPQSFRRPVPLKASVDMLVRRVVLPSPQDVLNAVWNELKCNFVVPFPDALLASLRHNFQNQTRSAVHVIRQLQQQVAVFFCVPGSFLSAANLFSRHHESKRITSLFFDENFQSLVAPAVAPSSAAIHTWLENQESRRIAANVVMRVQELFYEQQLGKSAEPQLLESRTRDITFGKALTRDDRRELIGPLAAARRTITCTQSKLASAYASLDLLPGDKAPHEQAIRDTTIAAVNELIVLLDQCATATQVQNCLVQVLDDWTTCSPSPLANHHCFLLAEDEKIACPPQPRRDHVTAMLQDLEITAAGDDEHASAVNIPGCIYRIIRDRATIAESDWFDAFADTFVAEGLSGAATTMTSKQLFNLFVCGVRHLQISGLIRIRRVAGKDEAVYEKTALVWCGGD